MPMWPLLPCLYHTHPLFCRPKHELIDFPVPAPSPPSPLPCIIHRRPQCGQPGELGLCVWGAGAGEIGDSHALDPSFSIQPCSPKFSIQPCSTINCACHLTCTVVCSALVRTPLAAQNALCDAPILMTSFKLFVTCLTPSVLMPTPCTRPWSSCWLLLPPAQATWPGTAPLVEPAPRALATP